MRSSRYRAGDLAFKTSRSRCRLAWKVGSSQAHRSSEIVSFGATASASRLSGARMFIDYCLVGKPGLKTLLQRCSCGFDTDASRLTTSSGLRHKSKSPKLVQLGSLRRLPILKLRDARRAYATAHQRLLYHRLYNHDFNTPTQLHVQFQDTECSRQAWRANSSGYRFSSFCPSYALGL